MDNIIQQLINIENRAQKVVSDAKELEMNFDKVVSDRVEGMRKDIAEKAENRIESVDSFEREDADKRIERIRGTISSEKEKLLKKEADNHTVWVDKIFNEIIII